MVDLVDRITNDPDSNNYRIKFLKGITLIITKKSLKSRNMTDIASIPIF